MMETFSQEKKYPLLLSSLFLKQPQRKIDIIHVFFRVNASNSESIYRFREFAAVTIIIHDDPV